MKCFQKQNKIIIPHYQIVHKTTDERGLIKYKKKNLIKNLIDRLILKKKKFQLKI